LRIEGGASIQEPEAQENRALERELELNGYVNE
jgi:hypothetical protein